MGTLPTAMIKPASAKLCKFRTAVLAAALLALLVWTPATARSEDGSYETWSSERLSLIPRESVQLQVEYDQIQVRNWRLIVDGGDRNCDLHIIRLKDKSLVYQLNDERHHEVIIPWGEGEAVSIAITNRNVPGEFIVSLQGPPRDQVHASYSFHVNRALDKYGMGQRLAAEDECRLALRENPQDGVAKVLLAGFLRDRHYYDRAAALVAEALQSELPGNMRTLAENMSEDLVKLRAPLPEAVQRGLEDIESQLIAGEAQPALDACDKMLDGELELDNHSRSRFVMLRGQALDQLGRNFEALDTFTRALQLNRNKDREGVIYFHMGRLFLQMDNLPQAEGAFTMALQHRLPSGLDVQAREALVTIEVRLGDNR